MSGYWEVIAPVAVLAFGAVVALARRLRHPPGTRGDRAHLRLAPLDATPDTLARWGTVPVAEVEGEPPWEPEHGPGSLGTWFPHDDPYGTEAVEAWIRDGMQVTWTGEGLSPEEEAALRRELHHVDLIDFESSAHPGQVGPEGIPGLVDGPRNMDAAGAGDESEACGPPAPPAPPTRLYWSPPLPMPKVEWNFGRPSSGTDLANARLDLFMVAMRADHERWLASARVRWAAA